MSTSSEDSGFSIFGDHRTKHLHYRVHDNTSSVRFHSDGFSAPSGQWVHITKRAWKSMYNDRWNDNQWKYGSQTLDELIEHISNGWCSAYHNNRGFESDWISTTSDLDWAVWEITRRLTRWGRDKVELSSIDYWNEYSDRYYGCKLAYVDGYDVLRQHLGYANHRHYSRKENKALNVAASSSEMLYYGKIFSKDIVDTVTWTKYETPFCKRCDIMEGYFRPVKYWCGDWLDDLVWDPWRDSYYEARNKIRSRRDQLASSRGQRR